MIQIDARNLLGDSIYMVRPVRAFMDLRGPLKMFVFEGVSGAILSESFPGMCSTRAEDFGTFDYDLNAQRVATKHCYASGRHISYGFAAELEVESTNPRLAPDAVWRRPFRRICDPYVAIAPFSACCPGARGGVPLKMLAEEVWERVYLDVLRNSVMPVKVIAGPGEHFRSPALASLEHVTGSSLEGLQHIIESAAILICIDNGIGHLASVLGRRTVSLWPSGAVSPAFIAPEFGIRTTFIDIHDAAAVTPERMAMALRAHLAADEPPEWSDIGVTPVQRHETFSPEQLLLIRDMV